MGKSDLLNAALIATALAACNPLLGIDEPLVQTDAAADVATGATDDGIDGGTNAGTQGRTDAQTDTGNDTQIDTGNDTRTDDGGGCIDGKCPVLIVGGMGVKPVGIAVDRAADGYVYFANFGFGGTPGGAVQRVPKAGPATKLQPVYLAKDRYDRPSEVAISGNRLVWSSCNNDDGNNGSVHWSDLDGSNHQQVGGADAGWNGPWGVFLSGDSVLFTNRWSPESVQRLDLTTKTVTPVIQQASHTDTVAVVQILDFIFWLDDDFLYRANKDGTGQVVVGPGSGGVGIATQGTFLFWSSNDALDNQRIMRLDAASCASVKCMKTLSVYQGQVTHLAVDADRVYWTDAKTSTVSSVSADGGAATVIANTQRLPEGIAVDDEAVYWVTQAEGNGAVWKLAK